LFKTLASVFNALADPIILFLIFKSHDAVDSEPWAYLFEIVVIFKKMLLTGALTIIAPGSPVQLVVAIVIVLFDLLVQLKLGPYKDFTDDVLSFLVSLQLTMTLILGLFLSSVDQQGTDVDEEFIGFALILLNSVSFFALFISLILMHPKLRKKVNICGDGAGGPKTASRGGEEQETNDRSSGESKKVEKSSTKVVPVAKTTKTKQSEDLKNWRYET
jgi:hypothetical protein